MSRTFALLFALLVLLAGCDPLAQVQSAVPQDEDKLVRRYLWSLIAKDFAAVEAMMKPEIVNADTRESIEKMPEWLPETALSELQIVDYGVFEGDGVYQSDLYYQYRLKDSWVLANIVLESRGGGALQVAGLHFQTADKSWTEMNAVSFADKDLIHLAFFAVAVFNPLFILFALVRCIRTPMLRRKWLWIIFILVGVTAIELNWTTGEMNINFLYVLLFGAAFWKGGPISPLLLTVGIPLGAIVFLKRKKWLQPPSADAPLSP